MVVPYPAAGLFDAAARVLAEPMRKVLGRPVVIDALLVGASQLGGTQMRKILSIALVFLAASIASALGQTYPSRPITMMVPFPPGGLTDVVGRLIAEGMRTALGQTIINRECRRGHR
jgi:tripartite-type tricarboxylate transporter receptor subunit TctC